MPRVSSKLVKQTFLGIEGGGTQTTVVLEHEGKRRAMKTGACNLRLIRDRAMLTLLQEIKTWSKETPVAIGGFFAGCRTPSDVARAQKLLKKTWPQSHIIVGNDGMSALAATLEDQDGAILVCGTGSVVRARRKGKSIQVGGWGHVVGDRGSGFWMGRILLRLIFRAFDVTGKTDSLSQSTLAFLGLNTFEELVQWSLEASKTEIASLTKVLFRYPTHPATKQILTDATDILAKDVALAVRRAGFRPSEPVLVAVNAGLAKHQEVFWKLLSKTIRRHVPKAKVFLSEKEGAYGALWLARKTIPAVAAGGDRGTASPRLSTTNIGSPSGSSDGITNRNLAQALTEQRNPRTLDLHLRTVPQLVDTMMEEESHTIPAIKTAKPLIGQAITWIVEAFQKGGRLFYVGAGTSGRIGVLDASECPPTFGTDPEMVQGIMAGGFRALYQSMEGVEDDRDYGKRVIHDRGVTKKDVVVGIAASGSTPFVLAALEEASKIGAKTILLTFNPHSTFNLQLSTFLKIAIPTGPEVVTGSTRLKAGSATKLVLNMFTTVAMIRMGKVRSNLMVDLDPSCEKLHDRAARIYSALKSVSHQEARDLLEANAWDLKRLLKT
jgi:N-acetylmuramic acid 6-phosphate etherase